MTTALDSWRNPPLAIEEPTPAAILQILPTQPDGAFNNLLVNSLAVVTPGLAGLTVSENLLFSPDNTYDIGQAGANRPRNLIIGTSIQGGNPNFAIVGGGYLQLQVPAVAGNYITIGSQTQIMWAVNVATLGLIAWTDNVSDIGMNITPYNRPRNIYAATSIVIGSSNAGGSAGVINFQHPSGTNVSQFASYNAASGQITLGGSNVPSIRYTTTTGSIPPFVAGDHYLVAAADGTIHVSSLGPAS